MMNVKWTDFHTVIVYDIFGNEKLTLSTLPTYTIEVATLLAIFDIRNTFDIFILFQLNSNWAIFLREYDLIFFLNILTLLQHFYFSFFIENMRSERGMVRKILYMKTVISKKTFSDSLWWCDYHSVHFVDIRFAIGHHCSADLVNDRNRNGPSFGIETISVHWVDGWIEWHRQLSICTHPILFESAMDVRLVAAADRLFRCSKLHPLSISMSTIMPFLWPCQIVGWNQ